MVIKMKHVPIKTAQDLQQFLNSIAEQGTDLSTIWLTLGQYEEGDGLVSIEECDLVSIEEDCITFLSSTL